MRVLLVMVLGLGLGLGVFGRYARGEGGMVQMISLDGPWLAAKDPENIGREKEWFRQPVAEAEAMRVPWLSQDVWPGYFDTVWYWREVEIPKPAAGGRILLRFWSVYYYAEVWLNGVRLGEHECGGGPFVFDITEAAKAGPGNRLAVRVIGSSRKGVDHFVQGQIPGGHAFNYTGIEDSVELLLVPEVYIEDVFVQPRAETGDIDIEVKIRNCGAGQAEARLELAAAPAGAGDAVVSQRLEKKVETGETVWKSTLRVPNPRLWELEDPYLYQFTARLEGAAGADVKTFRCGFRDFRVDRGYFRLNGRRIFLRSTHTGNDCPVTDQLFTAYLPDFPRRDMLNLKTMGFNMVRWIMGTPSRQQLDLCDEIGLLIYAEHRGSWLLENSAWMEERFHQSLRCAILRDRNHVSVVMWGLLNECPTPWVKDNGPVFEAAVNSLGMIREMDPGRLVWLHSGRWDCRLDIGSAANPGSGQWQCLLGQEDPTNPPKTEITSQHIPPHRGQVAAYVPGAGDVHIYPRAPHDAEIIKLLRTAGEGGKNIYVSEYGIASGVDLARLARQFEQRVDAQVYYTRRSTFRQRLEQFQADWDRWQMAEVFGRPEDFFRQCQAKMAGQRTLGFNAIRANPHINGVNLTGALDHGQTGEGVANTYFREWKPGAFEAMFDGFYPLRWCLFAEPVHVYRGAAIRLEAVLANEDVLAAGKYPARLEVFDAGRQPVFSRKIQVKVPGAADGVEPPMAFGIFSEEVKADWPEGKYHWVATFEHGAAAAGGEVEFYVTDRQFMPEVETELVLAGRDPGDWLKKNNIKAIPFEAADQSRRQVIIVFDDLAAEKKAEVFRQLAERIARGSTVLFLRPEVFAQEGNALHWLPLKNKGTLLRIFGWVYPKDEWARSHPIFEGLPAGGLMDYTYYRELIPDYVFSGLDTPAEAAAGAIETSFRYSSGLLVGVYKLGAGRFVLNTLRIQENLDTHPAAERLLRNMIRFAGQEADQPLAPLPADFQEVLAGLEKEK